MWVYLESRYKIKICSSEVDSILVVVKGLGKCEAKY